MPTVKRPKTFVVTLRADIRDAATIYSLLTSHNLHPRNPSELTSMSIAMLADLAKAQNFPVYTSTADALAYLQKEGLLEADIRRSKNYQTILKQLSIEDGTLEELRSAPKPIIPTKKETNLQTFEEQITRRRQEFEAIKTNLGNFPEGMVVEDDGE